MTSTTFFIIFIPILGILLLAINLILAPHNPLIWTRKLNIRDKLLNYGETLKLLILSNSLKTICGWTNYSDMVISQKIYESIIGYRVSKPVIYCPTKDVEDITVKEQRVNSNWCDLDKTFLKRNTLFVNYRVIPTKVNYLTTKLLYDKSHTYTTAQYLTTNVINPWFITGQNKSLVVWGTNLTSTTGERFTLKQLALVDLAPYQFSVIVGLILSDGWLIFASKTNKNARLGFKQSVDRAAYVLFVFNLLSHYCSSSPTVIINKRANKVNYGLEFFTRSMPCITKLHSIFYSNGVKIVPHNIYELLTPIALAHLIMGDGQASRHGLVLCTNSYSIQDVVRLMNVLMIRYRLECTIHLKRQNQKVGYLIYIRQGSISFLRSIVSSYLHPSMYYKLDL